MNISHTLRFTRIEGHSILVSLVRQGMFRQSPPSLEPFQLYRPILKHGFNVESKSCFNHLLYHTL